MRLLIVIFFNLSIFLYGLTVVKSGNGFSHKEAVDDAINNGKVSLQNNQNYSDLKLINYEILESKVQSTADFGLIFEIKLKINFEVSSIKQEPHQEIIKPTIKVKEQAQHQKGLQINITNLHNNCNLHVLICKKGECKMPSFTFETNVNYHKKNKKHIYKINNKSLNLNLNDGIYSLVFLDLYENYFMAENIDYKTYVREIEIVDGSFFKEYDIKEIKLSDAICNKE